MHGLRLSVSATTRPMRAEEQEGRDYYFLSDQQFRDWVAEGRFLEWAEYAGHMYGTPADPVQEMLEAGEDVILEIELKGAEQVLSLCPEALVIYIIPPSAEELERRLRGRKTESEQAVRRRMSRAREEIAAVEAKARVGLPPMHYVIVNDSANRASMELATIIETTRKQDEQTHSR